MANLRVGISPDAGWLMRGREPATASGLDLLLFPELVDGGYAALAAGALPHTYGDEFLERFRHWSAAHHSICVAGSVLFTDRTGKRTNTSLVFRRGRPVHRYDKIHLFRPGGDHRYFTPGREINTFTARIETTRVCTGVILCFDLRFPELTRALALQGMDLLVVPARWPAVRDLAWRTLLRARAIENQIFVLGCNAAGPEGGYSYGFDPFGEEVLAPPAHRRTAINAFTIDLSRIPAARQHHRNLHEARILPEISFPRVLRSHR